MPFRWLTLRARLGFEGWLLRKFPRRKKGSEIESKIYKADFIKVSPRPYKSKKRRTSGSLAEEKEIKIRIIKYLVDPASSHMLVSKIKPCMSKHMP